MAAGGTQILQEYLVKLGFVTDKLGEKKMKDTLALTGKNIASVGTAIGEMAVAAEVAVGLFANQMEKLYYASKLSGSSAANFKALSSAETSVGLAGGTVERITKGINLAMNSGNPAMKSYIENVLGVKTAGRDMTAVLISSAQAIKKMSQEQGDIPAKAAAARLGFSDEDYFLLIKTDGALEKLNATDAKRRAALQASGVDYDKATAAGVAYSNMLETLGFKLGAIKDSIMVNLLPAFSSLNTMLSIDLDKIGLVLSGKKSLYDTIAETNYAWWQVIQDKLYPLEATDRKKKANKERNNSLIYGTPKSTSANLNTDIFTRAEGGYNSVNRGKANGFTAGTEDLQNMTVAQVMAAQRRHKFAAAGHYQLMQKTLQQAAVSMGLNGNEKFDSNLQDRIFKEFIIAKKRPEIEAYISGKSNNKKAALGALSKEFASFTDPSTGKSHYSGNGVDKASVSIQDAGTMLDNMRATRLASAGGSGGASLVQNNTFNITGTDGHALSKSVIAAQSRTNGDAVRALAPRAS